MTTPAPSGEADFGVIIAAKPEHLHWVRGTCASVRYFMGETPICLVLDGEHPATDLVSTYGVRVLRRADVDQRELREVSFGSLRTKNTAFWISPFETFLFVDADAVVWGDMRRIADFERFDVILNTPIGDPERVRKWVMDVDRVSRYFPDFDARAHAGDFVNSGAFFARRGMLDVHRYIELIRFARGHPGLFYGSQGVFNFMLFSAVSEGTIRLEQRELQIMTGDTTREEVTSRFGFEQGVPVASDPPVVLHWAGSPKPRVRSRGRDYFEPMTFFRRQFRLAARGGSTPRFTDDLELRREDMLCRDWRGSNLRGRQLRMRRRIRQLVARARVAVRSRAPDELVAAVRRRSRTGAGTD